MLIKYLKDRKLIFIAILVWVAIFSGVFALCGIEFKYIWYPTLLGCLVFCIFLVGDFIRYYKKCQTLIMAEKSIDVTLDNLPKTSNQIEEMYTELLKLLTNEKNEEINNILNVLAISTKFDDFSLGILNYDTIVYYLSFAFIFVFLTIQTIKKKRFS